jgi:FHS family L-fucose permease-like MFS transporter
LWLGALGIFMYVGAEVAIGSVMVNFIALPEITGLAEADAAHYVAWYWGGAMVGRFVGALLMQRMNAGLLLAIHAAAAMLLLVLVITGQGQLALFALLLVGIANSIMFPTIFSLALHGLGKYTSQGAGLLCLAIVGGALVPLAQGKLADTFGLALSFILPIFCYIYICYFGLRSRKVTG